MGRTVDQLQVARREEAQAQVIVAGGGIAGMATCLELLDSHNMSGTDIVLVLGPDPGGRLSTIATPVGHCERGAGRFSTVLHPHLTALAERFSVPVVPFKYRVEHSVPTALDSLEGIVLKASDPDTKYGSFFDYAEAEFGQVRAEALASAVGYQALRDPRFPVVGGLELVSTHPESFLGADFSDTWVSPSKGFETLVSTLRESLRSRGVRILESDRVTRISEYADSVGVTVRGLRPRESFLRADQVILAIPPRAVRAIKFDQEVDLRWVSALVDVDLFKGFFTYAEPWWDTYDRKNCCVITDDALLKVYFDSANSSLFFYVDGWHSTYWHSKSARIDEFTTEALGAIQLATGLPLDALQSFISITSAFWPAGVVYSQTDVSLPPSRAISERIAVVSDALSTSPGWIEGALDCAHDVVAHLGI